jgi:prephenate dehydrogenase
MPLTTTAILGTGLLGGSLALALRKKRDIILYSRREESVSELRQAGFKATTDPHSAVAQAQEIIFCLPAGATIHLAKKLRASIGKGTFITDVVSTKANIVDVFDRLFKNHAYFIGSHPMAGGEKTGFSAARADLFYQANVILTPTAQTSPKAIQWAKKFWKPLHTYLHILSPKEHDKAVAQISHFPHLLAACLVASTPASSLFLVGPGYRDTTRIAASSPEMWTEIFLDNSRATIAAAHSFIANLQKALILLNKKDCKKLYRYLLSASKKRNAIPVTPSRTS